MTRFTVALVLAMTGLQVPAEPQKAQAATAPERELARIAMALPAAVIGVAAIEVESGRTVALNGHEWFPMASTYKVPIAVTALTRVSNRELSLTQLVEIRPTDLRPGSDLSLTLQHPGAALSLANLIDLSISTSDNTAADRVLQLAGGPAAVTRQIRAAGIQDMNVDRSTLQVLLAFAGAEGAMPDEAFSFATWNQLTKIPADRHTTAALRAAEDRRDATTPLAMSELLKRLVAGGLLPRSETDFLMSAMTRARGATRLRGMLPPGVNRAPHKSGTLLEGEVSYVNDVGVISMPNGRRLAVSIFVKNTRAPLDVTEQIIGHLARTVYDAFVVDGSPGPGPSF